MVNLRDVAQRAGVSVPTASRVLSGSDYPVLPELRRRVEEAADALDYVPNAQAQGLLRGSTGMIGVLAGDVGDPYFANIIHGIHRVATQRQLLVTICHTERDVDRELEYFRMLQAHRADAVILAGSGLRDARYEAGIAQRTRSFEANGGRVIAIGTTELEVDHVEADNVGGARALGEHLAALGHRHVGVLAGRHEVASTAERVAGLREVLEAEGGTVRVRYGEPTRDDAYEGTGELLEQEPGTTALVGTADQLAIGALARLRAGGQHVPAEVSVAGFNDIDLARDLAPALTTVRLPLRCMGETALRMALEPRTGQGRLSSQLATDLIIRASTGPVPVQR